MPAIRPFTRMMVEEEISVLRRLHGKLAHDPIHSREEFVDLMKATFGYGGLDARRLADDLGYSFSTVYRWIDGRSAPHPSLWPRIVQWIMDSIEDRIDGYERSEADMA